MSKQDYFISKADARDLKRLLSEQQKQLDQIRRNQLIEQEQEAERERRAQIEKFKQAFLIAVG